MTAPAPAASAAAPSSTASPAAHGVDRPDGVERPHGVERNSPASEGWPGSSRPSVAAVIASVVALLFVGMHWLRLEPIISVPFEVAAAASARDNPGPSVARVDPAAVAAAAAAQPGPPIGASHSDAASQGDTAVYFAENFASPTNATPHMHAASAISTRNGTLTAFWYGGSAEGARDVSIFMSTQSGQAWTDQTPVVIREAVESDLNRHIRKLGNASVVRQPDGRLWMFFVTVSIGGWAGSAINLIESRDDGRTWSAPRRLVTSPFLNVSTLVRANPFRYADGSIGLPAYHEFIGKFAELIRIDPDGRVIGKTRLSTGRRALQPDVVVMDEARAVLLLRDGGPPPRHLLRATTDDGGKSWTEPAEIDMPNPDAAVDALALDGDRLLAVLNDSDEGRERLILALSDNLGLDWQPLMSLADSSKGVPGAATEGRHEYSYPWVLLGADGLYHVLFTWNRERIRHVAFNRTWLERQAGARATRH